MYIAKRLNLVFSVVHAIVSYDTLCILDKLSCNQSQKSYYYPIFPAPTAILTDLSSISTPLFPNDKSSLFSTRLLFVENLHSFSWNYIESMFTLSHMAPQIRTKLWTMALSLSKILILVTLTLCQISWVLIKHSCTL